MKFLKLVASAILIMGAVSCTTEKPNNQATLFTEMPPDSTGLSFVNALEFDKDFNIFTYRNFYNGGGVGIADFNNDGLVDVYFNSNQGSNKLFLNKGNFKFEDITDKAGVAGTKAWSTGVSIADVNGDGFADIYVCNSGDIKGDNKQNELFINNGDLTFTDKAAEYGVNDKGFTTHAAFFDYDRDGDLDLYILNNSYQAIGSFNLRKNERDKRNELGGDKLLRNDGNHFVDVSVEAGIYGSTIGFGLGVVVGDINKDGWLDIFVSNDFFERDYLYINNKNGTFKECLPDYMKSISGASMGADLADINNDGWSDIFVTEMLPKDPQRLKTVTTFEDWNRYQYSVANDYYHQFTRNMLQLNNGDNSFSEIGRLSGVQASDWSWGALIFDMDNDGRKDIFVANGIFQDLTNQDFLQYASNEEFVKTILNRNSVDYKKLTEIIPSNPIANIAFHNDSNFVFKDVAEQWGMSKKGFSNGSAYGDLDNDGDLDLVVNNVNMQAFVYRNNTNSQSANHFLKFELKGEGKNTAAIGTKITVKAGMDTYFVEQMPMRGFESTVDARPLLGLGKHTKVDQVIVNWPNGTTTVMDSVSANQTIVLNQKDAKPVVTVAAPEVKTLSPVMTEIEDKRGVNFVQQESPFNDFDRDFLIFHMVSTEGPRISKGDVNNDGLDDFYIGGPKNQAGALYLQTAAGQFIESSKATFAIDAISEDMGSVFFDADNDGDLDLYVCSGGTEVSPSSSALMDRLYINDGKGEFTKSKAYLVSESTSSVAAADYDNDGDVDLFVGVRMKAFSYGPPMNGYILNNDGQGNFKNVTKEIAPALIGVGMITDGLWSDVDGDKDFDLVIVGEYMPVKVFLNSNGKFTDESNQLVPPNSNGWWNRIKSADLDHDGDIDFVVGNHGLNSIFHAKPEEPVCMYVGDFDENGTTEHVVCVFQEGKSYPLVLRHDLVAQMPALKKKYLKYEDYKAEQITDIFTPEALNRVRKLEAFELQTSILLNDGKGKFTIRHLPVAAQFSPTYGINIDDFNNDGNLDILLGGNLYNTKPQVGRYDASYGLMLTGDGKNNFTALSSEKSGIRLDGEVRDILTLKSVKGNVVLVSRNNNSVVVLQQSK